MLAQAANYAAVLFRGAAAIWSVNVLAGVARSAGQMGTAAMALIGTMAMHLVLCPLLVFGAGPVPPLGVAGAAASTVACDTVSALALLAWLSRTGLPVRLLGGTGNCSAAPSARQALFSGSQGAARLAWPLLASTARLIGFRTCAEPRTAWRPRGACP